MLTRPRVGHWRDINSANAEVIIDAKSEVIEITEKNKDAENANSANAEVDPLSALAVVTAIEQQRKAESPQRKKSSKAATVANLHKIQLIPTTHELYLEAAASADLLVHAYGIGYRAGLAGEPCIPL